MDASLRARAEQLASEMASQATTVEDLNGLMRLMMKSALERMLDTEMDVHLGRRPDSTTAAPPAADPAPATDAAVSTKRPPYITPTRSQTLATTPRSWVIRISANPCSRCKDLSKSRY